ALPAGEEATALQQLATALGAGVPASLAGRTLPAELAVLARSAALAEGTGADLSRALRSAARDARRGRARDADVLAAQLAVRLLPPPGRALPPASAALGRIPTVTALLAGPMALAPGAAGDTCPPGPARRTRPLRAGARRLRPPPRGGVRRRVPSGSGRTGRKPLRPRTEGGSHVPHPAADAPQPRSRDA